MMREMLKSFNPANGEVVGEVPVSRPEEISETVVRAHRAALGWRDRSREERAQLLGRAAEQLDERAEELGHLLSREMGKPLKYGIGEVRFCSESILGKLDEMVGALQPHTLEDDNTRSTLYYEPFGVCAAISPWNYPMSMPQWLILPALVAGNAVVLKPSEETPLIAQAYVDTLNEFLPAEVLQIVHGADEQGRALVKADVDLIAFTGSRPVGKHILGSAADKLKRVILELGGKDPFIVLPDADIEAAAQCAMENGYENGGQMCVSSERAYVHESIAEAFEQRVAELVGNIRYGPWDDESAEMGPMINERQRLHVIGQIEDAIERGATVLAGGMDHPPRFVVPTVLGKCDESMTIMRDETFGPVLAIQRVGSAEEAVRLANDNPLGLGGSVFGSPEAARAVARRIESGMVGVNKSCFGASGTPWVGAKESGYGYHGSVEGHRQFAQVKVISEGRLA
jgi:acyl-CoA reductase-like NAD-dependent aldehyde dehydrogenase